MKLGEIRNERISFLEAHGLSCNPFYHVFVNHRAVGTWIPPENLDLSRIHVANDLEVAEISAILEEDQEFFLAEEFRGNFEVRTPDHVFLCLYDELEEEIKGIAYYKVWEKDENYIAMALGLHFRPKFESRNDEIRNLIQATLSSLQQLGVTAVWSRVSSQCFDQILELYAAGFELAPTHAVVMSRSI